MILNDEEIEGCQRTGNLRSICRAIEAAVLEKLAAGVSAEPFGYLDGQGDAYTLDQLNTVVEAARAQSLEDCLEICNGFARNNLDLRDAIRALIGVTP